MIFLNPRLLTPSKCWAPALLWSSSQGLETPYLRAQPHSPPAQTPAQPTGELLHASTGHQTHPGGDPTLAGSPGGSDLSEAHGSPRPSLSPRTALCSHLHSSHQQNQARSRRCPLPATAAPGPAAVLSRLDRVSPHLWSPCCGPGPHSLDTASRSPPAPASGLHGLTRCPPPLGRRQPHRPSPVTHVLFASRMSSCLTFEESTCCTGVHFKWALACLSLSDPAQP